MHFNCLSLNIFNEHLKHPLVYLSDRGAIERWMNTEDPIVKIEYCRTPLGGWQVSSLILHHSFLVLKTRDWWWSVEKMPDAIIVQRSRDYEKVFLYQKGVKRETGLFWKRPTIDYERNPKEVKTVEDVVYCLWTAIFEKYNLLMANCRDFARDLFAEL